MCTLLEWCNGASPTTHLKAEKDRFVGSYTVLCMPYFCGPPERVKCEMSALRGRECLCVCSHQTDTHLFVRNALRHCQLAAFKWSPTPILFFRPICLALAPHPFNVCYIQTQGNEQQICVWVCSNVLFNLFISYSVSLRFTELLFVFCFIRRRMCGGFCVCVALSDYSGLGVSCWDLHMIATLNMIYLLLSVERKSKMLFTTFHLPHKCIWGVCIIM